MRARRGSRAAAKAGSPDSPLAQNTLVSTHSARTRGPYMATSQDTTSDHALTHSPAGAHCPRARTRYTVRAEKCGAGARMLSRVSVTHDPLSNLLGSCREGGEADLAVGLARRELLVGEAEADAVQAAYDGAVLR